MPKVWNLGNTTVRNPNRLRDGLVVLAREFQGKAHGPQAEALFSRRLKEEGVIVTSGGQADWFGRKWRSAFVKLGFIVDRLPAKEKSELMKPETGLNLNGLDYEITPAGQALVDATSQQEIADIFLRQLSFLELASPTEKKFDAGNMKPFIFLLQVLSALRDRGEDGLNPFEIGAFLQLFRNQTDAEVVRTVDEIVRYRKIRNKIRKGAVAKKKFDRGILAKKAAAGKVNPHSLIDYADTTIRYSKMSGLLSRKGERVVLLETKKPVVDALIKGPLKFYCGHSVVDYLKIFYLGSPLPTDSASVAKEEIVALTRFLQSGDPKSVMPDMGAETDIKKLNKKRHELNELSLRVKEQDFANQQVEDVMLQEIHEYLDAIGMGRRCKIKGVDDPASFFEWAVWRGLLAIDHFISPVSDTRRFPIDEDLKPRNHAPGGGPDMVFEFEDFILVVEVTLLTSSRQEAAEGESVRRHVADIQAKSSKKVYGIFVAPSIDTMTADTFRKGDWYYEEAKSRVDIVPITTGQFKGILGKEPRKVLPTALESLITGCLLNRDTLDTIEWKRTVSSQIESFTKQYSCN